MIDFSVMSSPYEAICIVTCRTLDASKAAARKIRFAPGKGNSKLFVLYNTRLDIRDITGVSCEGGGGYRRRSRREEWKKGVLNRVFHLTSWIL